jgi:CBS domain-containing protein
VQTQAALEGSTLESMMITDLRTVAPDDALSHAAQLVIDGFQQDFPVIEHGAYVGMLSRADLVKGLSEHGRDAPVRSVMRTGGPVFDVAHPPSRRSKRWRRGGARRFPSCATGGSWDCSRRRT